MNMNNILFKNSVIFQRLQLYLQDMQ